MSLHIRSRKDVSVAAVRHAVYGTDLSCGRFGSYRSTKRRRERGNCSVVRCVASEGHAGGGQIGVGLAVVGRVLESETDGGGGRRDELHERTAVGPDRCVFEPGGEDVFARIERRVGVHVVPREGESNLGI